MHAAAESTVHPYTLITFPPAQLIIGAHEHARNTIKEQLMRLLCSHHGCAVCASCRALADEQHHATTWIQPTGAYTLEDLDAVFASMSFALEEHQHHFFIISRADFLTPQCSNRLLKSLEEPPHNYHFILLAEHRDQILATVRSRCIISTLQSASSAPAHERLAQFFTQLSVINPLAFHKELDQSKINEHDTQALLDYLLMHWSNQAREAVHSDNTKRYTQAQQMVQLLTRHLAYTPMPGSSALFWKNFMLEVQELRKK